LGGRGLSSSRSLYKKQRPPSRVRVRVSVKVRARVRRRLRLRLRFRNRLKHSLRHRLRVRVRVRVEGSRIIITRELPPSPTCPSSHVPGSRSLL